MDRKHQAEDRVGARWSEGRVQKERATDDRTSLVEDQQGGEVDGGSQGTLREKAARPRENNDFIGRHSRVHPELYSESDVDAKLDTSLKELEREWLSVDL